MNDEPRSSRAGRRRHPSSADRAQDGIRELRQEVRDLRRANERRGPQQRPAETRIGTARRGAYTASSGRSGRRRRRLVVAVGAIVLLVVVLSGAFGSSRSFALPTRSALAGLSTRERILAFANSQLGYSTNPQHSYCNKFSSYWDSGGSGCPGGLMSEEWCADFAAWAWQKAGVPVSYGYGPGELNAGAASFYEWGVAHGSWHPVDSDYVARTGDVAVYGLSLAGQPSAAHVAIVTGDASGRSGPDVINGDGNRTGFSVVETGTDQSRADTGKGRGASLSGYVSPA